MQSPSKGVKEFALIAFIILGVLFGMNIMTFIFGNLGNAASSSIADVTTTINNETGVYLNSSNGLYTISVATNLDFNGGFNVLVATNVSDPAQPQVIPASNYTVDSVAGTITNSTATFYDHVNMSYTYDKKTDAKLTTEEVQNDSLNAIGTYSAGATTQMNVLSITVILVLLLGVFGIFWAFFMGKKGGKGESSSGNFG